MFEYEKEEAGIIVASLQPGALHSDVDILESRVYDLEGQVSELQERIDKLAKCLDSPEGNPVHENQKVSMANHFLAASFGAVFVILFGSFGSHVLRLILKLF